jgi:hypothetical protein
MMLDLDELLRGVALPGAIVAAALSLGWRIWKRGQTPAPRWLNGLVIGLAFAAGLLAINREWPTVPPRGYRDWLVVLGPSLGIVMLMLPLSRRLTTRLALTAYAVLLAVGAAAIVGTVLPGRSHALTSGEMWTWLLVTFLCLHTAMSSAEIVAPRLPSWALPLVLTMYAAVSAWLLGVGGSRLLAQYGGALAATTGATFLVSLLLRRFTLAGGGAAVLVALLGALLLIGVLFSEMPRHEAALLLLGPTVLWVGMILPSRLGWQRILVAILAALVPLMIVVILGGQRFLVILKEAAELGY